MAFYTLEDAQYLKEYYSDKIIGKPIDPSLESCKIEYIELKQWPIEKDFDKPMFSIRVVGSMLRGNVRPHRDIEKVAFNLMLAPPDSVLKNRG